MMEEEFYIKANMRCRECGQEFIIEWMDIEQFETMSYCPVCNSSDVVEGEHYV